MHSVLKSTINQTSGDKPESPKIVEDNVSDKANTSVIVEKNIQGSSVISAKKDRETDSEVSKAQTRLAGVNESRMEGQTKPTKKLKTFEKYLLKKKKRNKDVKEDKSKLETRKSTRNKRKGQGSPEKKRIKI